MSPWRAVRLVAGREVSVRLRTRSYQLATLAMVAFVVLGGALLKLTINDDPSRVGLTPETASFASAIEAISGTDIEVVTVADRAGGEADVRSGDLDALLDAAGGGLAIVVKDEPDATLEATLVAVAQQQALADQVSSLGGDPDTVAQTLLDAVPEVVSLDPSQRDAGRVIAAYLAGILIFLSLMTVGQMVAQGVVEEKASRVIELLLSTMRPWQMLAGKVAGIGLVGLLQVAAVVAAGAGTATALGLLDASEVALGSTALWTLLWFVIGFATYALAMAGLASLVSRQEEVGSVTSPLMTLMIVPYAIAVSIGTWDPDNTLVRWLSYLPFCSPFAMPVRVAGGGVEAWEVALSVGLALATIPLLVWLAGRMYARSILRTGARVKLSQALGR